MKEATITINGVPLTNQQSMTVRVALTSFHSRMQNPLELGNDKHGASMVALYRKSSGSVLDIILGDNKEQKC